MDNVKDENGDGSLCQTCKDGFIGDNCEINCSDTNDINYCNNNGICQNSKCVCDDNYRGNLCNIDCTVEDSNGIDYCNNNGMCKKGICECEEGYTGEQCNERI